MEEEDLASITFQFLQSLGSLHDQLYKAIRAENPSLKHVLNLVYGMAELCQTMKEKLNVFYRTRKKDIRISLDFRARLNQETAFRVECQLRSLRHLLAQGHEYLNLMCQNTRDVENIASNKLLPLVTSVQNCVKVISNLFQN